MVLMFNSISVLLYRIYRNAIATQLIRNSSGSANTSYKTVYMPLWVAPNKKSFQPMSDYSIQCGFPINFTFSVIMGSIHNIYALCLK